MASRWQVRRKGPEDSGNRTGCLATMGRLTLLCQRKNFRPSNHGSGPQPFLVPWFGPFYAIQKSQLQRCLHQRCKAWTRYLNSEGDYVEWATRTKARVYFAIASVRELLDTPSYILFWFNSYVMNTLCPSSGHHSHCDKTMAKRRLQLCSNERFIKKNLPSHEFTKHYRQKVRSTWERRIKLEIFHCVKTASVV